MASANSVVDCILHAASVLSGERESFSAEDLVVRVWQLYPDRFGLQGYARSYPDSNRVLTKIMGASGRLRREGLIERVGAKQYRLTAAGVSAANAIDMGDMRDHAAKSVGRLATIARTQVATLRRLLESRALAKYRVGEDLTFGDVAALLNISARSSANQFNVRYADALASIEAARATLGEDRARLPGSNTSLSGRHLDELVDLLEVVNNQFATELSVIRGRIDERYV
jgi:hypothetical protein